MSTRTKKISTLIESQLPGFISSEYENFSKFVEKYYEQLEIVGQPLDILSNLTKYRDINFYEQNLLNQKTNLSQSIPNNSTTITVEDASSFPKENGYIKIGDEICFYKERTNTQFLEVSRGVSGNNTLGDLYTSSEFVTTQAAPHYAGDDVFNISNLFLYAFVKNFETEYLGAFPEKYLKSDVDKRTLIKNISNFYRSKGTDRSIKFIFNSIISKDPSEEVSVYNPKDFTIKSSTSDWINKYALKVKVVSGNVNNLIGNVITQSLDEFDKTISFASAVVDGVSYVGKVGDEDIYELVLEPSTVNGNFKVAGKSTLRTNISPSSSTNFRVDVFSTQGFPKQGKLQIGSEIFKYTDKNLNQFVIDERSAQQLHSVGKTVYSFSTTEGSGVSLITLGILYNLLPKEGKPYSESGDLIQIENLGFETRDPVVYNEATDATRWFINTDFTKVNSVVPGVNSQVGNLNSDVSAIYEDDQYFYICSSSFPSVSDLLTIEVTEPLADQKHLKLIRKQPITTTEVYQTSNRDVGILIDGTPVFGYRDFDFVKYGTIVSTKIESKGNGYNAPPYVLINEEPNKALASLSGQTVGGVDLISSEVYEEDPVIRITSGENAKLSAIVTDGRITSIKVDNPGRYYSSPPIIRIIDELGKGNFAEYEAILSTEGTIESCKRITGGRFYTRGYVSIFVDPVGKGAQATASIRKWVKNRYNKLQNLLDTNNSYVFENFDTSKKYGYGVVANPVVLRKRLNDNINALYQQTSPLSHSPIIGYAYDGNPIYGPYGYSNPVDNTSQIAKLSSGYVLQNSRPNGPTVEEYSLGTFIDDYVWTPSVQSGKLELDQNNGRFCVTPDYPNGVYAYFLTIDSNNTPVFPYVLGNNFYSLPVDSNYNSAISQDDIPLNVKRLKTVDFEQNGAEFYGFIKDVKSGNVSKATVYDSLENFSVNSFVAINNFLTDGDGAEAIVSSVKGKNVVSLESEQTKAIQIKTKQVAYLFEGDIITQLQDDGNEAEGVLIGDVFNDSNFVLRNVSGNFNFTDPISSSTQVLTLILDKNSTFTKGSTITLTDGKGKNNSDLAVGQILEGIVRQNSVKIKVISGQFIIDNKYFLKSSNLGDTSRSKIISKFSLSENLNIFEIANNVAILKTNQNHGVATGDKINIDILPDDALTETTYYVRKRLYQKAILNPITHSSRIVDTGIGSADVLNSGADYAFATNYQNIELIFQDSSKSRDGLGLPGNPNNAKATIQVSNIDALGYGPVSSVTITDKGSGYLPGDVLTVADEDLGRLTNSGNEQRLYIVVDHVGFAANNSIIKLSNVSNLSVDDLLTLGQELVKIISVDVQLKTVTVERGQNGTRPINHFNGLTVSLFEGNYRFDPNYRPFGSEINKPYIISYNNETKEIFISYDYGTNTPIKISRSSSFFDSSTPAKLVTIRSNEEPQFKLEFSKNNETNLITNPIVQIQKYYKYKFDVSHFSMLNTYLDFSASSNYNIFTEEKFVTTISPGNAGSYLTVKLGFGPNIANNTFTERKRINFNNYFYFIKVSPDVNTEDSFLRIIDDPLSGEKNVTYVTDKQIVYNLSNTPEYDGTGQISYTTNSSFAIGKINSIKISNTGKNYKKLPLITGVLPSQEYECIVDPIYNTIDKTINGFNIINQGKNYSKPKVVVINSDDTSYNFKCIQEGGKITSILILNGGKFDQKPSVKIVESDVTIHFESENIGVPQNVSIVNNGYYFNNDKTSLAKYKSPTTFVLTNAGDYDFYPGETITQPSTGAKAKVSKNGWRIGGNLLKVENITGVFKNNASIVGKDASRTGTLIAQISTEFNPDVRSYYDNQGYYSSDKGKIGSSSQKLLDSYFYQDYSYVIKSKTPIQIWKDLIKETTHPAGFQLFGEVLIETDSSITMPSEQKTIETYSSISLGPINITVIETKKYITTSYIKYESLLVERGLGAVSVDTFDSSETLAYEVTLSPEFNGDFDPNTGKVVGTTQFTLIDAKNGLPLFLNNSQQLIVTLDGVLQEPGKSYTISGTNIEFSQPPFGTRVVEGQEVAAQRFYGRAIKFKNSSLNSRYFKKIKSIANQFDGIEKEFDLYYEDDSIVKTEQNENLIVTLNGIIQNAKSSADTQFGNSYYILRSEDLNVTDRIVFSSAPIDQEDPYVNDVPSELKGNEKCFIYTIGNYERFTIENKLIEFRGGGPYLILDEIEDRVKKIDEPLYAFVIIDGVLQRENDSYQIVGPNITFNEPLKKYISESGETIYQQVSIILAYGRNLPKTLTFYDFEPDTYYNVINLTVSGTNVYRTFTDLYNELATNKIILNEGSNSLGYVRSYSKISENQIQITLLNHNLSDEIDLLDPDLKIINTEKLEETTVLVEQLDTASYDYTVSFAEDGSGWVISDIFLPGQNLANSALTLKQGNTVTFDVNSEGRPFYILDRLEPQNIETTSYNLLYDNGSFIDPGRPTDTNPTIAVSAYNTLNLTITAPSSVSIVKEDEFGNRTVVTENITNNGISSGTISWDVGSDQTSIYYYQLDSDPNVSGSIFITNYIGTYYNQAYEVEAVQNNGSFNQSVIWELTASTVTQKYYYVDVFGPFYGEINVLTSEPIFVPVVTTRYKEYPIANVNTIEYEYVSDSEGTRILKRNVSNWLFNTKLGDDAWLEKNFIEANLYPGDKIQIDGESAYREILSIPNFVSTRNYNPSSYISNEIYSRIRSTNYEGITRGEGLSITAKVDFESGSISSLNVSDVEYNKRDLQLYFEKGILLQPTAYQYYTTPKVYFIPIDGNGGGAKAEVISYGGQILDVVLTDGGSGYTQPPKIVVARGYNRIKQLYRKVETSLVLNVSSSITITTEYSTTSTITLSGEGPAGVGIFSLLTLGGLVDNQDLNRYITQIVLPKPQILSTTQKKFDSEITLQSPPAVIEYQFNKFYNQIISILAAKADIISSSTISSTDREITRKIDKILNNAIIEIPSEAINDIGAFLDAPMTETDTIVYIPDTRRFPDASRLLIGKEIVRYAKKLPDRFLNVERGAAGTTAITHSAGDYLRHLPEFIAIIPVGPTTIFTTEVTSTIITQPTSIIQSISSIIVCDSVQNVDKEFDNQYQIEVDNTDFDVIKEVIIIPPTSFNIVTNIYSTQSYISTSSEAAGVSGVTVIADARMIDEANRQITTTASINLNLDITTSSQIVTEVDYSFSSVSSVVTSTLLTTNREFVSFVDINVDASVSEEIEKQITTTELVNLNVDDVEIITELVHLLGSISSVTTLSTLTTGIEFVTIVDINLDVSNIIESSNITLLTANTISDISIVSTLYTENVNTEIKLNTQIIQDNTNIQTSSSIISKLDVPLTVYTLSNLLTSKLAKNADVTRFYKTGSLDYFEEFVVLVNPIDTRNGQLILERPINEVYTRENGIILVANKSVYKQEFYDSYSLGNAGFNLKTFENLAFTDTGLLVDSNTIGDLSLAYPSLTLNDFETRSSSSITLTGEYFNLGPPSIQNPVVRSLETNLSSSSVVTVVGNTSKFPTTGYIFQGSSSQYSVISYTGKTSNSFTGCVLVSGSSTVDPGNDIIPYFI